jgi:hypothetical protein
MSGDADEDEFDWDDPRWRVFIWAACITSEMPQLGRKDVDWAKLPGSEGAVRMLGTTYWQITKVVEPLDENAWRREPGEFPVGQDQAPKALAYINSDLGLLLDEDNLDAFAAMDLDDFKRYFEPPLLMAHSLVCRLGRYIGQNVPIPVLGPDQRAKRRVLP